MATWMTHLRIADKLLDRIPGLSPIEFIMGNMAPDSGIPTETGFSPDVSLSHFREDNGAGKKKINPDAFLSKYFTPAQREAYDDRQYAFYLGYYCHLLTDCLWSDRIAWPTRQKFPDASWGQIKANWYALDYAYLNNRRGFRAFRAYLGSVGFVNRFMDCFAPDAFENRRAFITSFYLEESAPETDCKYLTEDNMNAFVETAAVEIAGLLGNLHGV
ncbi:MAG: zinc dependent phospholipase C family protein [Oscillospiraceae bacterium]|nr:zinc dependent phospholipase C family protein [Oscillospiraceae bacterium]